MIKIDFYNKTKRKISSKIFLRLLPVAEKALKNEEKTKNGKKYFCGLTLISNREMTILNKLHHNKNCPTDVVSLSYFDKRSKDSFVGEIFICVDFAEKQAKEIGQTLAEELKFLFIHGLLHVFGYDHQKPKEEAFMKRLAYEILKRE